MSEYIMLGKIPKSPEERKALIGKRVEQEEHLSDFGMTQVQSRLIEFLTSEKGYSEKDLELNKVYNVVLSDGITENSFNVKADIVVRLNNTSLFIVKCVMSSMESWERHSAAFCRVVEPNQVPYAVVTDGEDARMIDAVSGKLLSLGLDSIPSKDEALVLLKQTVFCPFSRERCEKEKRILHAFDAITCSTASGKT